MAEHADGAQALDKQLEVLQCTLQILTARQRLFTLLPTVDFKDSFARSSTAHTLVRLTRMFPISNSDLCPSRDDINALTAEIARVKRMHQEQIQLEILRQQTSQMGEIIDRRLKRKRNLLRDGNYEEVYKLEANAKTILAVCKKLKTGNDACEHPDLPSETTTCEDENEDEEDDVVLVRNENDPPETPLHFNGVKKERS